MEKIEEIWKPIKGYEHFLISNMGNVYSLNSKPPKLKILQTNEFGYKVVQLQKKCRKKMFKVHRLVADAFIPNPDGKPQINHKDFNRSNNCVENLEWCTAKENIGHASCHMHGTKYRETNTGEHHISFDNQQNRYRVSIGSRTERKQIYFKTLNEAINYRDEELKRRQNGCSKKANS